MPNTNVVPLRPKRRTPRGARRLPVQLRRILEHPLFGLPDPNEALDIAQGLYTIDPRVRYVPRAVASIQGADVDAAAERLVAEQQPIVLQSSQRSWDGFVATPLTPGSPGEAYHRAIEPVMRSYAHSLVRAREELNAEKDRAQAYKDDKERQLQRGQASGAAAALAWRWAGPVLVGAAVGISAYVVGAAVPAKVAERTPEEVITTLAVAAATFITRWLSVFWGSVRKGRVSAVARQWELKAELDYAMRKLNLYVAHYEDVSDTWQRYSGEAYGRVGSQLKVLTEEVELRRRAYADVDGWHMNEVFILYRAVSAGIRVGTKKAAETIRKFRKK